MNISIIHVIRSALKIKKNVVRVIVIKPNGSTIIGVNYLEILALMSDWTSV